MKKPTKEELEASLKKTQEELEVKKEPVPSEPAPSEPIPSEPAPSDPEPSEPEPEEPTPSEPAPSPDYKEKFSNSSREAQKIHAKNRKINEGVSEANKITDIEEAELIAEYPDWDVMSDTEKKLAKKNMINDKRFEVINKATEDAKKIEKWADDVNNFIEDPKTLANTPDLEGKQEEFIKFANRIENHAVPFNILVGSFLYDMSKQTKPKNKGKMFEIGSGGPNAKLRAKGDKITIAEASTLMKTDYKKYKEYLLAGKIESVTE